MPNNIRIGHNGYAYTATLDGYDGAPDATGPSSFIGTGDTETDAVQNLKEQIEDHAGNVSVLSCPEIMEAL